MAKDDKTTSEVTERKQAPDDVVNQPYRKVPLPKSIQSTIDNDEKWWNTMVEGNMPSSTEENIRYAAYGSRVRTILVAASRYVAYTSDIGESFRPVAHPYLVKGAYAVSWLYLAGDVSYEGYKGYLRNQQTLNPTVSQSDGAPQGPTPKGAPAVEAAVQDIPKPGKVALVDDYRVVAVQRAIFQSIASMGLPAFTVHSIVKYSGRAFKDAANKNVRTWAPIGLGLAAVPALPFMFDKPVEEAVEWSFHKLLGPGEASGHHTEIKPSPESKKEL